MFPIPISLIHVILLLLVAAIIWAFNSVAVNDLANKQIVRVALSVTVSFWLLYVVLALIVKQLPGSSAGI